jgi:hypothetical protein
MVAGLALPVVGCDRKPENPPADLTPPPPRPTAAATVAASAAAPEASAAPELPVSVKLPAGIVADQWTVTTSCTIDAINGPSMGTKPVALKAGNNVRISGWAYDSAGKKLPDAVHVRFASPSGTYYALTTLGGKRDDVQKAEHLPADLTNSGFELNFDAALLAAGDYSLILLIRSGEKTYLCDNGRKIHVES